MTMRPFAKYGKDIEILEMERRAGHAPEDRLQLAQEFIRRIGADNFLEEARRTFSLREIARFYDIDLVSAKDLSELLKSLAVAEEFEHSTHKDVFYYAYYFAPWGKEEVPLKARFFRNFDNQISSRVELGGSLQAMLKDIVSAVGYVRMRRFFETMGINRVEAFLQRNRVLSIDDLGHLDDLCARHLIDQIIMKTDLPAMRVDQL